MTWQQNYEPLGGNLALSTLVAPVPVLVLFIMLRVKRKPAWMGASTALRSAVVIAVPVFGMPVQLALWSTIHGAAFGIFPIAWIVFSSILLCRLAIDIGEFEIIKESAGGRSAPRQGEGGSG